MSIYNQQLDALGKNVTTMRQDILYKLDDTNSTVTMLMGLMDKVDRSSQN
ncbi:MAG TPA: hypothetical protein VL485_09565 [Ktedonobacteraceae bacterium]|jgi:hypothetical protein|nr:hypothetical protein [Ktedonobacteraceae bacterium]